MISIYEENFVSKIIVEGFASDLHATSNFVSPREQITQKKHFPGVTSEEIFTSSDFDQIAFESHGQCWLLTLPIRLNILVYLESMESLDCLPTMCYFQPLLHLLWRINHFRDENNFIAIVMSKIRRDLIQATSISLEWTLDAEAIPASLLSTREESSK